MSKAKGPLQADQSSTPERQGEPGDAEDAEGIDEADDEGGLAADLEIAIVRGDAAWIEELLKRGAPVNVLGHENRKHALLSVAVVAEQVDAARLLLAAGAAPEGVAGEWLQPLARAVHIGSADMVGLLLEAGAQWRSPNPLRPTALFATIENVRSGRLPDGEAALVVASMLRHGVDDSITSADGLTALEAAERQLGPGALTTQALKAKRESHELAAVVGLPAEPASASTAPTAGRARDGAL